MKNPPDAGPLQGTPQRCLDVMSSAPSSGENEVKSYETGPNSDSERKQSPQHAPLMLPVEEPDGELSHTNFTDTFLKSILTSIDSKDPVVANAWLETLLDVIDLLPKDIIRDEILGLAVAKGPSPHVPDRLAACKLIGKISTKFDQFILKTEVVGLVQSLCQDVCGDVRGGMCTQLACVAKGLGPEATKHHILPDLVELCSDEETGVRLAGINTVVHMICLVDKETRVGTLVPLVRKFCERSLKAEDATLPVTAHLLGRLCHGLHEDLNEEQEKWFLNYYCTLSVLGLPDAKRIELPMPDLLIEVRNGEFEAECRQQCAYNLPGMIVFVGGSSGYRSLHSTVCSFLTDPSMAVRHTLALCFHQICSLIGWEVNLLRDAFLQMLRAESFEVLSAVMVNLPHIMIDFSRHNVITLQSPGLELLEFVGALKQGEETLSVTNKWRVHSDTLGQMACLIHCLPSDLVYSELVPLMIIRMHASRPLPCRMSAARTLLIYFKNAEDSQSKERIASILVKEFCQGTSCHKRMLFLRVCEIAFDILSAEDIKRQFFHPVLSLHIDGVPNIRLKLVNILPQLKGTLTLPDDKIKLQDLETVVGSLLVNEEDRDVCAAISTVITSLDKIEVKEGSVVSQVEPSISGGGADQDLEEASSSAAGSERITAVEHKSPTKGTSGKPSGLGQRQSAQRSSRRGSGEIPSYLERRKSGCLAPKQPPDEQTLQRISTLDPSTDEFLVDAGIRISESAIRSRLPAPQSPSHLYYSRWGQTPAASAPTLRAKVAAALLSDIKTRTSGSRLQQPVVSSGTSSSRIPAPSGRGSEQVDLKMTPSSWSLQQKKDVKASSPSSSRLRSTARTRPVSSLVIPSSDSETPMKAKSLSHENLRDSSPHLTMASGSQTTYTSSRGHSPRSSALENEVHVHSLPVTSASRLRQPRVRPAYSCNSRPMSCRSSPGTSRSSSPGLDVSGGRLVTPRASSASSSPTASRSSSPGHDDRMNQGRSGELTLKGLQRMPMSDPPTPTTPPPPMSFTGRKSTSGIPTPLRSLRINRGSSKLPLPTNKK